MTKAAITTIGAALLAAAALALSGCSYPGDDEDRAAFHAEAQDPVPSAPATEPTEPETPAEETGDESTAEGGQGERWGAPADPGFEAGHVRYLRAIQNFSPRLSAGCSTRRRARSPTGSSTAPARRSPRASPPSSGSTAAMEQRSRRRGSASRRWR